MGARSSTWSGRGDQQLDSFHERQGALRIEWEAKRVAGASAPGSLKIVVHSAISGRPLAAPIVEHRGEGRARHTSARSRACSLHWR